MAVPKKVAVAFQKKLMAIRSTKTFIFPSLKLFREDLDEVVSVFRATNPGSQVSVEDGERVYESFEQMQTLNGDEVEHLVLQNDQVGIKLDLQKRRSGLALSTVKMTDEADLTFYRAREFLQTKTRTHYWEAVPISVAMGFAAATIPFLQKSRNATLVAAALLASVFGSLVPSAIIVDKLAAKHCMFVTLKRRHEYPSFVKRNRDALILMFVSFLLGILGTLVVQHFQRK